MKRTTVVNIRDESCDVYVGRSGHGHDGYFGNPFPLPHGANGFTRHATLQKYKVYFLNRVATDVEFRTRVLSLRGKRLGCFCYPRACHAQIIADWVDLQDETL